MHEQYTNREEIEGSSERSFGIVFGVVFSIIGLWPLLFGGGVRLWSLVVAGIFVGLAFIYPQSLATLNRLWFRFGLALAKITNPIIMGLLYVLIFVPVGLGMRIFGRDALNLRLSPEAKTYWIDRDPPGPAPEGMRNQF